MGKHSTPGLSYWEARKRRKDLRNRAKPPRRRGPTKTRWFILFFAVGFLAGGAIGFYAKPLAKLSAKIYLSLKEGQWQPEGKEKQEVQKSLTAISTDPNQSVNTLVMGSDSGSNKGEGGWCRSDVMMLVCLQERDKKAVVISIPRDTKVIIPGHGTEKINAAHAFGGPSGAIDMVKQFLGIDVNHYVSMNFTGFEKIVDAIGGVPIHLSKPINDPHAGYLPAGDLKLDGWQALVVVRSRRLPNGDVDRIKNQQAFLKALMDKLSATRSVTKAKQLVDIVAANCKMDYNAGELMTLADELRGFSLDNVQFVTIPGVSKYISGASYFVANEPQMAAMISEIKQNTGVSPETVAKLQTESADQGQVEQLYEPNADVIRVLAGGKAGGGAVAIVAQELRLLGHATVTEGLAKQPTAVTVLYHRKEAKSAAETIKKSIPELAGASLEFNDQVTAQYNSPVVMVLGTDFATPSLVSTYGRLLQPAVNLDNLGKRGKSFT
jgi:LCP family protein required for cell wall assembly